MKLKRILGIAAIPVIVGVLLGYPADSSAGRIARSESLRDLAVRVADLDKNGITTIDEKLQMWVDMGLHVEEKYDYHGGTYFVYQGGYIKEGMYIDYIKSRGYEIFLNKKTDKYEVEEKRLEK